MRLKLAWLCLILPALAFSAETPIPTELSAWVTDAAGFMTPQAAQTLDKRLEAYEQSSSRQVFVYIGKTTGGAPIEDWAVKAFKIWKVGKKKQDNGVALFIMTEDRHIRIEVGYGLEGQLTDALTSRIIRDTIQPKILANDHDGAVTSGVEAIVNTLDGKPLPAATSDSNSAAQQAMQPLSLWQKIFYGIIALLILAFAVTHPSLAFYLLINILTSGRSGMGGGGSSGGSGGGGWSGGGGGRSGGGGASGSW